MTIENELRPEKSDSESKRKINGKRRKKCSKGNKTLSDMWKKYEEKTWAKKK